MFFQKANDIPGQEKDRYSERGIRCNVNIAPHGDLVLSLPTRGGLMRFRVASQILCLSSPVFLAMLGPSSSFKEASELRANSHAGSEPYVLSIEDDNPRALAVIFYALHFQNPMVPLAMNDRETVWHMAVICDKYDFTAALSIWINLWAKQWREFVIYNSGHGYWLFISWTFGLADIFTAVSKNIILGGYYGTADGSFLSEGGHGFDGFTIPDCVMGQYLQSRVAGPEILHSNGKALESILQQRQSVIVEMMDAVLFYLDKYLEVDALAPVCCYPTPTYNCDLIILGSMIKEYQSRIGLFPRPPNGDCSNYDKPLLMSINSLEETLKSIQVNFLGATPAGLGGHARTCNFLPELFTKIACAVTKVEGLKLESFNSRRGLLVGKVSIITCQFSPALLGENRCLLS